MTTQRTDDVDGRATTTGLQDCVVDAIAAFQNLVRCLGPPTLQLFADEISIAILTPKMSWTWDPVYQEQLLKFPVNPEDNYIHNVVVTASPRVTDAFGREIYDIATTLTAAWINSGCYAWLRWNEKSKEWPDYVNDDWSDDEEW